MRTIHYGIRLATVLTLVSLFYWGIASLLHQAQISTLIALLFTAYLSERLFALLQWMSPVIGTVDAKEQERTRKRLIEHELARSARTGSPLVIASIREKKRTSTHVAVQNLRSTDIVLRSPEGYLLVLMPETTIEQAGHAFRRLATLLSIKDIVMMDNHTLRAIVEARTGGDMSKKRALTPRDLRHFCIEALHTKLAGITASDNEANAPIIYNLAEERAAEALYAPVTSAHSRHV